MISFLAILRLLSARPRTVRMYHHLHTYLYYLFLGRHLSPRLRRFQIRPNCFLQRFAYFPCQISFCHGIYLFGANFFLPTGESDDFLSAANGLSYLRSSECTDTRVPESTSQTMSRGPIVSPSAFLSAGRIDRNKIGFQRFVKFIKKKFAFHANRKNFSRKFFG